MPRILCLDYGEKRTGIAVSDETRTIAQSLTTIHHTTDEELLIAVGKLVKRYEVDLIVVGLPISLSGKPSTRSEKIRRFASRLARSLHIPVELFDERFSTSYAQRIFVESAGRPLRRIDVASSAIDRIAATIILENYLNFLRQRGENKPV